MNLRINGEIRVVADNISLKELVTQLDLIPERIAIELNQHVVRRADWPFTVLRENDQVEIVHFVGGGEHQEAGAGSRSREEPRRVFVCSLSGVDLSQRGEVSSNYVNSGINQNGSSENR